MANVENMAVIIESSRTVEIDERLESILRTINNGNQRSGRMRPYPGQGEYVPTYVSAGTSEK